MFLVLLLFSFNLSFITSENTILKFSCKDLHTLYDESSHLINLKRIYDNFLRKNQVTLSENEIGYEFFKARPLDFNTSGQYLKAEIFTQTASLFYDKIKINDYDKDIPIDFQNYSHCFVEPKISQKNVNSSDSDFRSIDGKGNNLKRRSMGASFTSFGRFLKAQYDDNIHSIRQSIRGYMLPSARNIVRKLFLNDKTNLNKFQSRRIIPNMASIMFGQYIAYDVGSRQSDQYTDGGDGIRCCANFNKIQLPSSLMHSSCLPITISRSDPIYSPQNIKCMGFVRSNMIANDPDKVKVGEKVNKVTSFLDHSTIYGSDYKTMQKVRSFNGGRLKTNLRNVLPFERRTYFSGDDRVNQTPFYAIFHSIFVRNHNLHADKFAVLNPTWDEERLFQEARRMNIAIYQKIIFDEWLPIFLGKSFNASIAYDENVDASTTNEFSAGSFRFLHSFINSEFNLFDESGALTSINVSDTIMKPEMLENSFPSTLRGLLKQKINLLGYSSEILNKMFKNKDEMGLDLLSIDIVRGRDHGVPAYHKFRKMCNMKTDIKVFNDLRPEIPEIGIVQLRQTYKSVYDIDLLVGGALENIRQDNSTDQEESGFFGSTFSCIIGEQFRRFKSGDRYFYSHSEQFSSEQLKEISSYSFRRLLCENSSVEKIQAQAFLMESEVNFSLDCHDYS